MRSGEVHRRTYVGLAAVVLLVGVLAPRAGRASWPDDVEPPRLLLNEIMVNPLAVADDVGEWIELWNIDDLAVPMEDVSVEVVVGDGSLVGELRLDSPVVIPAGDLLVIGPATPAYPLDPFFSPRQADVDARYSGTLAFPNDTGTVRLLWRGEVIDELRYGGDAIAAPLGASLNREPPARPAGGEWPRALRPAVWCAARAEMYGPGSDRGTPGAPNTWCDDDGDGHAEDSELPDCDDDDVFVYPAAPEVCNGIDDDCDGVTDNAEILSTTLGCLNVGACADVAPLCVGAAGWTCPYPESYEAEETRCDGLDNDCDGATDEGLRNACGACGALSTDDCDGMDNDCDGETDEDASSELWSNRSCLTEGVCAGTSPRCAGSEGWLCHYPPSTWEAEESRCDGLDNDCNGETDEGFGVGASCTVGQGACSVVSSVVCTGDGRGAVCDAAPLPAGRAELCGDGLDNDCDGETDEGFAIGSRCEEGLGACRAHGKWVCSDDGFSVACSAVPGPPSDERCGDGTDNDCDGEVDEADCEAVSPPLGPMSCDGAQAAAPTARDGKRRGAGAAVALLLLPLLALVVIAGRRNPGR